MRNLLFTISFVGTAYHGWQIQDNARTVQQTVRDAFNKITGEQPNIIGCSRTDAGVHANMFCFSVKTDSSVPERAFPAALNSQLPYDISVRRCTSVPEDFNARYSCVQKEYEYLICTNEYRNPFYVDKALHYRYYLDEALMNTAAQSFLGTHDFSAFCSAHTDTVSKQRTISFSEVKREGDFCIFTVRADGFLYNMVRIMAGTLICVSQGKLDAEAIPDIIAGKDRSRAGFTAPPGGLYLNRVFYDERMIADER